MLLWCKVYNSQLFSGVMQRQKEDHNCTEGTLSELTGMESYRTPLLHSAALPLALDWDDSARRLLSPDRCKIDKDAQQLCVYITKAPASGPEVLQCLKGKRATFSSPLIYMEVITHSICPCYTTEFNFTKFPGNHIYWPWKNRFLSYFR